MPSRMGAQSCMLKTCAGYQRSSVRHGQHALAPWSSRVSGSAQHAHIKHVGTSCDQDHCACAVPTAIVFKALLPLPLFQYLCTILLEQARREHPA